MSYSKRLGYFFLLAIVVGLLLLYTYFHQNKIRDHHIVICGTITSIVVSPRSGNSMDYQYTFKSKLFSSSNACKEARKGLVKRFSKILVVIEDNNPSNSAILEDSQDFARYNVSENDTIGISCY